MYSCNHCWSGKEIRVIYSEFMFVALASSKQCSCAMLSFEPCLALQYFPLFFNVCHPEVFNAIYEYMMYQSNTINFIIMLFYCSGQHVSTLTVSFSGLSKIQILKLTSLKCIVGSQTLTFLIQLCIKTGALRKYKSM